MRTNVPHIFAVRDIIGQLALAHKAVQEVHVATEPTHNGKAFFDALTHRVIGSGIVRMQASGFISEIFLAVENVCDAIDIGSTIHFHSIVGESPNTAAVAFKGVCADLPPMRKNATGPATAYCRNLWANLSETHHG